jgi:hypothetical protein
MLIDMPDHQVIMVVVTDGYTGFMLVGCRTALPGNLIEIYYCHNSFSRAAALRSN